jgi:hypothetical protein
VICSTGSDSPRSSRASRSGPAPGTTTRATANAQSSSWGCGRRRSSCWPVRWSPSSRKPCKWRRRRIGCGSTPTAGLVEHESHGSAEPFGPPGCKSSRRLTVGPVRLAPGRVPIPAPRSSVPRTSWISEIPAACSGRAQGRHRRARPRRARQPRASAAAHSGPTGGRRAARRGSARMPWAAVAVPGRVRGAAVTPWRRR